MNIRFGEMTANEAIGIANNAYRNAQATGNLNAFTSEQTAASAWANLIASIFMKPEGPAPTVSQRPSISPYLIAGGAAALAILALN